MRLNDTRTGMTVIDREECLELLAERQGGVGRLALVEGGSPVIFPVNFATVDDTIVFRTSTGTKLAGALKGAPVAFEIDHVDQEDRSGWSVVVRGRAEVVAASAELERVTATRLAPFMEGREVWVVIRPSSVTGRAVGAGGAYQLPDESLG